MAGVPGVGGSNERLLRDFPELEVKVSSSFAYDVGDMVALESVSCIGQKLIDLSVALPALLAVRGGWSRDGENSPEVIKDVALSFALAIAEVMACDVLHDLNPPPDLVGLLSGRPEYHPPKAELHHFEGRDLVLVCFYERGHISNRGRHWTYHVKAYDVSSGAEVALPSHSDRGLIAPAVGESSLPTGDHFTEEG